MSKPKETCSISGFSILDSETRGWAGDSVTADRPGRGGAYLKEPQLQRAIWVFPHQPASFLNTRSTVTFRVGHSQLRNACFWGTFQRCQPRDRSRSLGTVCPVRRKPRTVICCFLLFFLLPL